MAVRPNVIDCTNATEALIDLCADLDDAGGVVRSAEAIGAEVLPPSYRALLDHRAHMTAVLSEFHGADVALHVLAHRQVGDVYRRKIVLTVGDADRIVEFGLVRLDLSVVGDAVRTAIIERRRPLGAILIAHDVLTRVVPRWFVRFAPDSPVVAMFGTDGKEPVYGRIGMIYFHKEPAVELLEVVTDRASEGCA
jgi:hypothetical protein